MTGFSAPTGDLVAEDEELDVLGGRRATRQRDQPEHLSEDQIEEPQRHSGIMYDQRSLLVSGPDPTSGTPQVAWFLAVDAEGKSLEDIATPLAAAGTRRRGGSVRAEGASPPFSSEA